MRPARVLSTRRAFVAGAGGATIAAVLPPAEAVPAGLRRTPAAALAALEASTGGRLGVYACDGEGATIAAHRADERFPMCSTWKLLAVAEVLRLADTGALRLDEHVAYGRADLLGYAPVTSANVGRGSMTLAELCAAAITRSDNTAANLVLAALGGPAPFTASLRGSALRDSVTRLDHREPDCNAAIPGDPRDTTTPRAIARDLAVVVAPGDPLAPASRALLNGWLRECRTGLDLLRAGFPPGWAVGDKTGSGARGTRNDVAIVRPPGHRPLVIAAYLTGAAGVDDDGRARAVAQVGTIVANAFAASRAR